MRKGEIMGECLDLHCKKAIFEIRDFLQNIDQKISHLIEQNRVGKCMYRGSEEGNNFNGDEND